MREAVYTDQDGRRFAVLVPDDAPEEHVAAGYGVVVGPPEALLDLGLPTEVAVELHNQLFDRGIITRQDARRRRQDVLTAWQSALRVDLGRIIDAYEIVGGN